MQLLSLSLPLSLSFYVPISLYSISFFLTSALSFHPQTSLSYYDSVSVGLFVIFDPFSVFFLSLYFFFPLFLSLSVFALSSVLCVCWTARLACSKGNANRQLDRSRRLLFTWPCNKRGQYSILLKVKDLPMDRGPSRFLSLNY